MESTMSIDINYWIKDVALPQIRGRLILELLDLSDQTYQKSAWMLGGQMKGFYSELRYPYQMIFDELVIDIDNEEIPYYMIGDILKNKQEAEALFKVAKDLDNLVKSTKYDYDVEYESSPLWEVMVNSAKIAYNVFIKSEQDNKEFLEFIEVVKANMRKKIEEKNTLSETNNISASATAQEQPKSSESSAVERVKKLIKEHLKID